MQHPTRLIIALDYDDQSLAMILVEQLDPAWCALKVGHEMFTRFGLQFVRLLIAKGFKVFLDLKFHDIPNTVARACAACADLGVWMLNVHASGGLAMMKAAKSALVPYGDERPLLIAVTILTSLSQDELLEIGLSVPLEQQVSELAWLAKTAGLDGVVSSAKEAPVIRARCGDDFCIVTPGIRLSTVSQDDQKRVVTPVIALEAGAHYLVIGRPITQASNPMLIVHDLLTLLTGFQ